MNDGGCHYVRMKALQPDHRIFNRPQDYSYFLRLLKKIKKETGVKVFAFCFLEDTVYLIVQAEAMTVIKRFLSELQASYRSYFSTHYDRTNCPRWRPSQLLSIRRADMLFDRIKSLEFKPVQKNLILSPISYPWSSCSYRVLGDNNGILDRGHPPTRRPVKKGDEQ